MKNIRRIAVTLIFALLVSLIPFGSVKAGNDDAGEPGDIKMKTTSVSLCSGQSVKLGVTITGQNMGLKWSSSNKQVATVNSKGKVTPKSTGICYIYVKNGKKTAKCKVTVYTSKIYSNDFHVSGTAVQYYTGQKSCDKFCDLNKTNSETAWHVFSETESKFLSCKAKNVVKTRRGITIGMTKNQVRNAYGTGYTGSGVTAKTDGVYHVLNLGDTRDNMTYANLYDIQRAYSCMAYNYNANGKNYQIRFYLGRNDKVKLIAYTKGYDKFMSVGGTYTY